MISLTIGFLALCLAWIAINIATIVYALLMVLMAAGLAAVVFLIAWATGRRVA